MKKTVKKLLALILAITTVLMCLELPTFSNKTLAAESKTTEDGMFKYEIDEENNTVTITEYIGSATVVEIPKTIEGKSVTAIGDSAFYENTSVTSITIPEGVTVIGDLAFAGCGSLTSINIPEGVTQINKGVFRNCDSVTNITLPEGVTTIGYNAFYEDINLTSINIPDGVTTIGEGAFDGCRSLASINIPAGVTKINNAVFRNCHSVTNITIPEGVTTIGEYSFSGCYGLTSINIPKTVASIDISTFENCYGFTTITVDKDNPTYKDDNCNAILSKDGKTLVHGCKTTVIPSSVITIGDHAFYGAGLTSIEIPSTVKTIGSFVFTYNLFTEITIPSGVKEIQGYAFSQCNGLTSIVISESVRDIGSFAFYSCISLKSVKIVNCSTGVGMDAFSGCSSLETVYAPCKLNLNTIGIDEDKLPKLYLIHPISNGTITKATKDAEGKIEGKCSIWNEDDYNTILSPKTIELKGGKTQYYNDGEEIRPEVVVKDSMGDIISADNYDVTYSNNKDKGNNAKVTISFTKSNLYTGTMEETFSIVDDITFLYSEGDEGLTITGCEGDIVNLSIPSTLDNKTVVGIGASAFADLSTIETVHIPATVTAISTSAFSGCTAIRDITIDEENSVYSSGTANAVMNKDQTKLFLGCKNTTIPYSVTSIGENAFVGCTGLASITIPTGVTEVKANAFSGCSGLTSVLAPCYLDLSGTGISDKSVTIERLHTYTSPTEVIKKASNSEAGSMKASCSKCNDTTVKECTIASPASIKISGASSKYYDNGREVKPDITVIDTEGKTIDASNYDLTYSNNVQPGTAGIKVTFTDDGSMYTGELTTTFDIVINATEYTLGYVKDGAAIEIVKYKGNETEVVIPKRADGKNVISIGIEAFKNCGTVSSIKLPDTVTSIGREAFSNCTSLKNITLPAALTSIGVAAFLNCEKLERIKIPEGVTTISETAFRFCIGLKSIELSDGLKVIGNSAFANCSSLTEINIPGSVTNVAGNIFSSCDRLTSIIIVPELKAEFNENAFGSCHNLILYVDYNNRIDEVKEMTHFENVEVCPHEGGTATCTSRAVCTKCGAVYGETLAHNYLTEIGIKNKASSITAGVVTKKCYCGATKDFTIAKPAKIELSQSSYVYTGSSITPSLTVKDTDKNVIAASNYTVSYKNNKEIGEASVIVTFKGSYYEGSLPEATFTIVPPATSVKTVVNATSGITITWDKNLQAEGYEIYRSVNGSKDCLIKDITDNATLTFTDKNTNNGEKCTYKVYAYKTVGGKKCSNALGTAKTIYRLLTPTVSADSSQATVNASWNINASATGYEVKCNGTVYDITSSKTVSKSISTTANNTAFSFNVRTYKKVGEAKYYSAWSETKTLYRIAAPTLSSVTFVSTGMSINWSKNAYATGYYVYRSVNGGAYTLIKNITGNATISYIDTGATTNGAKYSYKIVAYKTVNGTTYTGVYSGVKTYYRLSAPVISSIANASTNAVTVKWTKNASATGYYIYRSVNGGAYTLIKNIANNSTISYTDIKATTNGAKYSYKLIAYKTVGEITYKSAYSGAKTCYRLSAPTISSIANASTNAITVKWNKNASATGYYIYRSVNGGVYTLIKTVANNATISYTDTKATTNGAKYSYKLIAYKTVGGITYKSAYSGAKAYYRLTTPTVTATNSATGKVTVKWNKNAKATGYLIKYTVGTTTKTVKITSAATVSKVLSSLSKGKTYKISVQAYKMVGKTAYYSGWSAAKSVKIVK